MSDYIVYKRLPCKHTSEVDFGDATCLTCVRQEYDLKEVDLEQAIKDVLQSNSVAYLADRIKCYL